MILCGVLPLLALVAGPLQTANPDTGPVLKVENGGLLFTDNAAGVSGTDAGFSLPIGTRTLWLFGDIFLLNPTAPTRNYVGGVSNAALLVASGRGANVLRHYTFLTDPQTGRVRPVLPYKPDETTKTRLWPMGSWYNDSTRTAYLFYARIQTSGGGPLDFRTEGYGLASSDTRWPERIQFSRIPSESGRELWWTGAESKTTFGNAVVVGSSDRWLYIVGVQERQGRKWGKLARVSRPQIAHREAYEYWAGTAAAPRWSRNEREAADVEGLTDFPTELSVVYNAHLGGFLAVHSVNLSERLRLSLAPTPWGPYKTLVEIGAPHQAFAQAFCYAGKEHPELAEQNGRVLYITYVDSQRYWLQLLKVTLR